MEKIDKYVKEAEEMKLGVQLFKEGCKEEDVKIYSFKDKIVFYNHELIEFNSVKEMVEHRFKDGDCLLDYIERNGKFPDKEIIFGDQNSKMV